MPADSRAAKIAFIGTHGVGKTTLCYELAAALKRGGRNVDVVKEVARQSPLPINQQTSFTAQLWILTTQIAEEIRSGSRHEVVVCDRSALDNYAYMVRACGRRPELEPFIDSWMRTYDVLFKVPVGLAATPDGVRDTDDAFVQAVDRTVDALLAEKGIAHERLTGERELWGESVRARLRAAGIL
jgi:nicotinamide riboside kinase